MEVLARLVGPEPVALPVDLRHRNVATADQDALAVLGDGCVAARSQARVLIVPTEPSLGVDQCSDVGHLGDLVGQVDERPARGQGARLGFHGQVDGGQVVGKVADLGLRVVARRSSVGGLGSGREGAGCARQEAHHEHVMAGRFCSVGQGPGVEPGALDVERGVSRSRGLPRHVVGQHVARRFHRLQVRDGEAAARSAVRTS